MADSRQKLLLLALSLFLTAGAGLSCQNIAWASPEKIAPEKSTPQAGAEEATNLPDAVSPNTDTDSTAPDGAPDLSKLSPETQEALQKMTEAIQREHRAVNHELRDDEERSYKDIAMLWQAAVERSGTIRYAIEKLSRKDATGQPVDGDGFTKRIVQSVARLGGIAGSMWTGNAAGMLGGGLVQELVAGDPSTSIMSRVTDADMLILAKEVENLQAQLIETYYRYRNAEEKMKLSHDALLALEKFNKNFQSPVTKAKPETAALQTIMDSLYQAARQDDVAAKQAFGSSREALALMVGQGAIIALEQSNAETSSVK